MFPKQLLFLVFLYHLHVLYCNKPEINIGVFVMKGTESPWSIGRSEKAIELGQRKLKEMLEGLATVRFLRSMSKIGSCTKYDFGALGAEHRFIKNTSVFIGPGCSTGVEAIGRMAADWNIPLITPVGINSLFDNKTFFPTLTRISFSFDMVGQFYLQLFQLYKWKDIAIIRDAYLEKTLSITHFQSTSLLQLFTENGLRVTLCETQVYGFTNALKAAAKVSRVIILLCFFQRIRGLLLEAHDLGMTNGEFVFIYFKTFSPFLSDLWYMAGDQKTNEIAKKAFNVLLVALPKNPESPEIKVFEASVKNHSITKYNYDFDTEKTDVHHYIVGYHDSFLIYGKVIKDMIQNGENVFDGRLVTKRMRNKTFSGLMAGRFRINENSDGERDLSVLDFDPQGKLWTVGVYSGADAILRMESDRSIKWPMDKGPPVNRPRCGFTGDDPICFPEDGSNLLIVLAIVFCAILIIFLTAGKMIYRQLRLRVELQSNWWKIEWEELEKNSERNQSVLRNSKVSKLHILSENNYVKEFESLVKMYKGSAVALTPTVIKNFQPTRDTQMEFIHLRNVNCINLTKFYGLTQKDSADWYIITEACSRGTLKFILQDDGFKINKDLQASLICDILKGCCYLHNSPIGVHGNLNSHQCLIDRRFVLKLDGFGLPTIRSKTLGTDKRELLYFAPELLRNMRRNTPVQQSADVYSFGMIVLEIITRKEPFEDEMKFCSIEDIIDRIKFPSKTPFRPGLEDKLEGDNSLISMMYSCLEENVENRPTFPSIAKDSKQMKWGTLGENFLDNLLSRMEEYANNLENVAEEKMHAFLDEKRRSEELLYQVLPRSIARDLIHGNKIEAEAYQCVTIYFSDIVGFTSISTVSTPMQVVDLLNDLYTCFDTVIENFDVYKVETIGDAYMVVSGLPLRNGNEHVTEIAKMSVSILDNVKNFRIRHLPEINLQARIGIHSGPVCAGVVGKQMPRYCLFGDTVNTASRMESNGEAMKIHVSLATRNLLVSHDQFLLIERGPIAIKGKGKMTTYWLMAKNDEL
ncbi:atrial natriuretic peptide receptor 1-like [Saccostrea echinata]|uniref:atrial natriuretic peptide receptor 1-like n=1 Tax=Saccostrea echinata TaxID=191078 RepID=UPI002A801F0D|nr:atrial natriuretic peptide receptor 1-like [Saccostrea echinata]